MQNAETSQTASDAAAVGERVVISDPPGRWVRDASDDDVRYIALTAS